MHPRLYGKILWFAKPWISNWSFWTLKRIMEIYPKSLGFAVDLNLSPFELSNLFPKSEDFGLMRKRPDVGISDRRPRTGTKLQRNLKALCSACILPFWLVTLNSIPLLIHTITANKNSNTVSFLQDVKIYILIFQIFHEMERRPCHDNYALRRGMTIERRVWQDPWDPALDPLWPNFVLQ